MRSACPPRRPALAVLIALLVAPAVPGCRSPGPGAPTGGPAPDGPAGGNPVAPAAAPAPVGDDRGAAPLPLTRGSPQEALAEYWKRMERRDWSAARSSLTLGDRRMIAAEELKQMARQGPPTGQSGAAWSALFPASTDGAPRIIDVDARGDRARVGVRSVRGTGSVSLRREGGVWKVDLLETMNAAGAAPS